MRRSSGPVSVQMSLLAAGPGVDGGVRVGFAIGKAVGGAVVRNRIRRRLRVTIRALLDRMSQGLPDARTLVVVRVLPTAAAMSAADLELHLCRAVGRCLDRTGASRPHGMGGDG